MQFHWAGKIKQEGFTGQAASPSEMRFARAFVNFTGQARITPRLNTHRVPGSTGQAVFVVVIEIQVSEFLLRTILR